MSEAVTAQKRLWLKHVLGVDLPEAQPTGRASDDEARPKQVAAFSPVKIGQGAVLWRNLSARNAQELQRLKEAVIAAYATDEEFDQSAVDEVTSKVDALDAVMEWLDEGFADELDAFLNLQSDELRLARAPRIRQSIAEYRNYVSSDPLAQVIDTNEFHSTNIKALTVKVLDNLSEAFTPLS